MKETMRRVVSMLLVMALALGAVQMTQGTTAQAAGKLTAKDFKFTGKKAYKDAMNFMYTGSLEYVNYLTTIYVGYDKSPSKVLKTNRGITLLSTKSQVFQKYGKVKLKKLNKTTLYQYAKNGMNQFDTTKKQLNMLKNSKCAVYQYVYKYKNKKRATFYLCFFFNNKDKVQCIGVYQNAEHKL